ncbi:MAG: spermidine synthase family protein [Planctomycetota bacterium]
MPGTPAIEGLSPAIKGRSPPVWTYAFLGGSALALQTILLREFLALFHSSELFAGAALGGWLVLVGTGNALGEVAAKRLRPTGALTVLYAVLGVVALGAAPLARASPAAFGVAAGTLPSLATAARVAAAAMAVPCLLVGASFSLTAAAIADTGAPDAARLYAWDAGGAVVGGGLLAALIALIAPDAVTVASLAALALGSLALLWGRASGGRAWLAPGSLVLVLAASSLTAPGLRHGVERSTLALAFPGEEVVAWEEAPDGRRVLARSAGGGRNLYAGGSLVASEVDESGEAEFAALAALSHPSPARVAALSWPGDPLPTHLARVVRDADVEASLPRRGGLALRGGMPEWLGRGEGAGLRAKYADARKYLRSLSGVDVIAYQPGMPEAFLSSRLVSVEAFGEAARALAPGGVVAVRLPIGADYLNEGARKVIASVVRAARGHFAHVRLEPMPHAGIVLLASDAPLAGAEEIARRYAALGAKPPAFRPGLLGSGAEREFRLDALRSAVDGAAATPNRDLLPSAIWYSARVTGSMHGKEGPLARLEPGVRWPAVLFVAIAGLCCLAPAALDRRSRTIRTARARGAGVAFAAGSGGILLEITILCAYQVRCGALYGEVSLLLALVMAGTGAGAWQGGKAARALASCGTRKGLAAVACALAPGAALVVGTVLAPGALVRPTLWLLAIGTGFVVGAAYPVALGAARVGTPDGRRRGGAGYVLAADLCGAGTGAALGGGLLVPTTGLGMTAIAGLALIGVAVVVATAFSTTENTESTESEFPGNGGV